MNRYNWILGRNFYRLFAWLGMANMLVLGLILTAGAASGPAPLHFVRAIEPDQTSLANPAGMAFSTKTNSFYILESRAAKRTDSDGIDLIRLTGYAARMGRVWVAAGIQDPINLTYDPKAGRVLFLRSRESRLVEVREDSSGSLDPSMQTRYDARRFGLQNPQGMAVDPESGGLYFLDAAGPRLVCVRPDSSGSFEQAEVSEIPLQIEGSPALRGIAFDPGTGHFHLISPGEQRLYEVTQSGQAAGFRDLSGFNLTDPRGVVFAPSGDQTDDAAQMSLYIADSGLRGGRVQESLAGGAASGALSSEAESAVDTPGRIIELSLAQRAVLAESTFSSVLIRTVDLAAVSPPSPDPSGLAYLGSRGTLLLSDGEVEETVSGITHFAGVNVWELTLTGSVVRTANISGKAPTVVPMTDEPTGAAWNPANGHYYFSDDNDLRIYDLNPGADQWVGTADDRWTSFSTQPAGCVDPEGIAFDSWRGVLFVVDGTNREVYQYTTSGSLIGQFDVQVYGVTDPESIEFNDSSGTLFVLGSSSSRVIVEVTTDGALLGTYDVSSAGARAPAGLAYAPASDGSGVRRFYIVDRGIDNNTSPTVVDGKMYEMSAPSSAPVTTTTPALTASPTQTQTAAPVVTATSAPNPFPSTGLLDDFNRPDGAVGGSWSGTTGGFALSGGRLVVGTGGYIFWSPGRFGADQEAYVTIAVTDPAAAEIDVLLKSQSSTSGTALLEVWYNAAKKRIRVATYDPVQKWVIRGTDIPVTFASGDQLGARAAADGKVYVYRNGVLLGVRDVTGWPYYASDGYIGLLVYAPCAAALDDFGGGTTKIIP